MESTIDGKPNERKTEKDQVNFDTFALSRFIFYEC